MLSCGVMYTVRFEVYLLNISIPLIILYATVSVNSIKSRYFTQLRTVSHRASLDSFLLSLSHQAIS